MKYIVDIKGEIEGDYEIIGKYEERPQGDLISRGALKNEFYKDIMGGLNWERIIDNAPTVTPSLILDNITEADIEKFKMIWQRATGKDLLHVINEERQRGKWIPVSEGFPNLSDRFLVTTRYGEVMTDFYTGEHFLQGDDIIAWQPLLEPYRVEVEQSEKGGSET